MAETMASSGHPDAGIDLSQFYQVFFEEAGENLDSMEKLLLGLDVTTADDEELNAIFRCAHSIKGGAATFGFKDVAELTHEMESLLDKLRRHELTPVPAMVDVLLAAGDALRAQLARHQGAGGDAIDTSELLARIRSMGQGELNAVAAQAPRETPAPEPVAAPAKAAAAGARELELTLGPLSDASIADGIVELFKEVVGLGSIAPIDGGLMQDGLRRFKVITSSSDADLHDLFGFHIAREQVQIVPWGGEHVAPGYGFHAGAPGAPKAEPEMEQGYGFFDSAPGAPGSDATSPPAAQAAPAHPEHEMAAAKPAQAEPPAARGRQPARRRAPLGPVSGSLHHPRVGGEG